VITIITNNTQFGIMFFKETFGLIFHKIRESFISYSITIRVFKIDLTLSLGMEKINVKEIEKAIKESEGNDASA
jgi:hypothetical protein